MECIKFEYEEKYIKDFIKLATKIYSKECKDCICKDIDINDYNTYDKYLKELDLPYFED